MAIRGIPSPSPSPNPSPIWRPEELPLVFEFELAVVFEAVSDDGEDAAVGSVTPVGVGVTVDTEAVVATSGVMLKIPDVKPPSWSALIQKKYRGERLRSESYVCTAH